MSDHYAPYNPPADVSAHCNVNVNVYFLQLALSSLLTSLLLFFTDLSPATFTRSRILSTFTNFPHRPLHCMQVSDNQFLIFFLKIQLIPELKISDTNRKKRVRNF